ncbi:MAG: VOC family protein, partial [Acidimicrobiaceae bacterium]|nr:VOC family protein [Acidimicrobiaceae bacterium]
ERITKPDGSVGHAEVRIGDSVIMLSEATDRFPQGRSAAYVYVDDVDAVFQRALAAGAQSLSEPSDKFYGNREAGVSDAFGNIWWIATAFEQVAPSELQQRFDELQQSQATSA